MGSVSKLYIFLYHRIGKISPINCPTGSLGLSPLYNLFKGTYVNNTVVYKFRILYSIQKMFQNY